MATARHIAEAYFAGGQASGRRANLARMRPLLTLVHSPLVGPAIWETLAQALRTRDHEVVVPDLTARLSGGPPYCSRQVAAIAEAVGQRWTVLVAHSVAGPLLAATRSALDDSHGYVFVDAALPTARCSTTPSNARRDGVRAAPCSPPSASRPAPPRPRAITMASATR